MRRIGPLLALTLWIPATLLGNTYDVKKFGAAGDKRTKDTAAIQAAIDACSKAGGGTVYFPPGDYLSGTLRLLSNVNLSLSVGATVWGSREPSDYTARCLIFAEGAAHISIEGRGAIRGIGEADLRASLRPFLASWRCPQLGPEIRPLAGAFGMPAKGKALPRAPSPP